MSTQELLVATRREIEPLNAKMARLDEEVATVQREITLRNKELRELEDQAVSLTRRKTRGESVGEALQSVTAVIQTGQQTVESANRIIADIQARRRLVVQERQPVEARLLKLEQQAELDTLEAAYNEATTKVNAAEREVEARRREQEQSYFRLDAFRARQRSAELDLAHERVKDAYNKTHGRFPGDIANTVVTVTDKAPMTSAGL